MIEQQLDKYNEELKAAEELSRQKIEALIESEKKEILYDWRDRYDLYVTLYEIVWCTSDTCERGWSLSDRSDELGYFHLLPNSITGNKAREINPTRLCHIERFRFNKDSLPKDMQRRQYVRFELKVIPEPKCEYLDYTEQKIQDLKEGMSTFDWEEPYEACYAILPEFVPLAPEGFVDFGVATEQASPVGYNPITEIMLAIESKVNKMNDDYSDDTAD